MSIIAKHNTTSGGSVDKQSRATSGSISSDANGRGVIAEDTATDGARTSHKTPSGGLGANDNEATSGGLLADGN